MPTDANQTQGGDQIRVAPVFQALVTPVEMQRSYYLSVNKILRQGSLAFRKDRNLQRQMRYDPDIMGPLVMLQLSVACSEWAVQVPADMQGDEQATEQAAFVEKLLRNTPRFTDMMRHLLDALWYGRSAVNMVFGKQGETIYIRDWMPIHGDSLTMTELGQLGLKVGPRYYTQTIGGAAPDTDKINGTVIGWDSRVLPLDDQQRATIALHIYQQQGVDFDEIYEAENAYLGRGMRDLVWYYWSLKQAALQNWATYIERYSMGIRVGNYPVGNEAAKADMESAMQNLLGDVSVLIPKNADGSDAGFGIDIKEPNGGNAEAFAKMVEYLTENIKEVILGQTGTSQAVSSGLGSSIGDQHAQTLNRQVTYIANALAETITREIVTPLFRMNFGDDAIPPSFSFSVSKPNPDEYMKAIEAFTKLGGRVSEREARRVLGLAEPEDDEMVLQAPSEGGMGGGGMPPLDVRPMGDEPGDAGPEGDAEPFSKDRFALSDVDLTPPKGAAEAAERGLELRRKHGRGGTEVGVARARDLSNRKTLSPSTVRRMHSFFSRHAVDSKGEGWGEDSAGWIAHLLWGGDAAKAWAKRKVAELDRAEGKDESAKRGSKDRFDGANCGTGAGGFKPGNTCGRGDGASGQDLTAKGGKKAKKKTVKKGAKKSKRSKPTADTIADIRETPSRKVNRVSEAKITQQIKQWERQANSDKTRRKQPLQKNADEMPDGFETVAREFSGFFYAITSKSSLTSLEEFTEWFNSEDRINREGWLASCRRIVQAQGNDFPSTKEEQIQALYETGRAANTMFHAAKLHPPPLTVYRGINVPEEHIGKFLETLQTGVFATSAAHSTSRDAGIATSFSEEGSGVNVVMRIRGVTNGWDQEGNLTARYEEEEVTLPPNVYEVTKIQHSADGKTLIVDLDF